MFEKLTRLVACLGVVTPALACASSVAPAPSEPPPCDQLCKDGTAMKSMRESMKLAFNLTLQGKPVGSHDVTTACPLGGGVRIIGTASAEPVQGATIVDLTYFFEKCVLISRDDDVEDNYAITMTGTIFQKGTLAVQPTSSTALSIKSDSLTLTGTIREPPEPFVGEACKVVLAQDGNRLTGEFCGRTATVDL